MVVPVAADRIGPVADAVARGFVDNEVWVWIQPNERRRLRLMVRNYRALIRRVFLRRGAAWTTEEVAGAALWIAPGEPKRHRGDEIAELISLLPWIGTGLGRAMRVDATMKEQQPREPHWYLEVLSVEPARQRQGYGSALLAPGLERCDADGMPAYLETQREANVPFYRRFGFELIEQITIPHGPPLWTMWREARSS
jgi:GNAT superfamily N-acetyltransferase